MTGFLYNLIATARRQRPVLQPRPLSRFETKPLAQATEEPFTMPQTSSPRITQDTETVSARPAPETRFQDTVRSSPTSMPPLPKPVDSPEPTPMAPPPQRSSPSTFVAKVIREIQTAAPAPPVPSPAMRTTPVPPVSDPTIRRTEAQKDPAPGPAIPRQRPPDTHPQAPLPRVADVPPVTARPAEMSTRHRQPTVERHFTTERLIVESATAPRVAPAIHQPQAGRPTPKALPVSPASPVPPRQRPPLNTLQAKPAGQPAVRVSIGTVEIRAVSTPRRPAPRPRIGTPPPLSLDDYLGQRHRGAFE